MRKSGSATRSARIALGTALGAGLAIAVVASAVAADPTPHQGPTAGGTTVTVVSARFTAITTGGTHSVAIGSDGKTYAWGGGTAGQLGNGSNTSSGTPVVVTRPTGTAADFRFTAVDAGEEHSLGLGNDGNVYAWGADGNGTVANIPTAVTPPADVPATFAFTAISTGGSHSLALGNNGKIYAWGSGSGGRLGNGSSADSSTLVQVTLPFGAPSSYAFTAISAGGSHSLAIGEDGLVYAWGVGADGQLGDGSNSNRDVPGSATVPVGTPVTFDFTAISAGGDYSLAIGEDGKAYSWGADGDGQLGNGAAASSNVPTAVTTPAGAPSTFAVTAISAGGSHSLAIGNNGETYSWGLDGNEQLGNGATGDSDVPTAVTTPAGVPSTFAATAISAGFVQSFAIGNDDKLYGWGYNGFGTGSLAAGPDLAANVPTPTLSANFAVSEVTFDGDAGTNLAQTGSGATVDTPAHAAGPVDVVVSSTLRAGTTDTSITATETYSDGFTYTGPSGTALPEITESEPLPVTG